jgi:hypothetical protein
MEPPTRPDGAIGLPRWGLLIVLVLFGIGPVGIELRGWVPLVTTKRQPLAVELRAAYRFD